MLGSEQIYMIAIASHSGCEEAVASDEYKRRQPCFGCRLFKEKGLLSHQYLAIVDIDYSIVFTTELSITV